MVTDKWDGGTVHLKKVDKDLNVSHTEHHCWNRGLFIATTSAAEIAQGGQVKVLTKAEYEAATRRRPR